MAKKPVMAPDQPVVTNWPTSPSPPRRKAFPLISTNRMDLVAVGAIVDQLEDTIRVLLGKLHDMPHSAVTRKDIEAAISEAERLCKAVP